MRSTAPGTSTESWIANGISAQQAVLPILGAAELGNCGMDEVDGRRRIGHAKPMGEVNIPSQGDTGLVGEDGGI